MKNNENEKLLRSIGNVEDKFIEEAAPNPAVHAVQKRKTLSARKIFMRALPAAVCAAVVFLATAAYAENKTTELQSNIAELEIKLSETLDDLSSLQNTYSGFYMRYLSPETIAIADEMALQYGAEIYFEGLKSGDQYQQFFSINKLVEYYNDEEIRVRAIEAIKPFAVEFDADAVLDEKRIPDSAAFALSILEKRFDDPRIIHMADGTIVFTLFNDYSDYGTFNQFWTLKDGELTSRNYDRPQMYITGLYPSPDKRLLAISFCSNKSSYIQIHDFENGFVSPELIDSARVLLAKDLDYTFWQRIDYENYSGFGNLHWINDSTIEFHGFLGYDGLDFMEEAHVRYNYREKTMEYELAEEDPVQFYPVYPAE